jgi:hypothetical protein
MPVTFNSQDTYVGTAGGEMAAAIELGNVVREIRTGPMKKTAFPTELN